MQPAAGTYDQALQALVHAERGSYGDLSYMPVFRASALFYALAGPDITTRIAFLNYWREKNGNPDVGVLVTVRDAGGRKRARRFERLAAMTYDFDLREMLGSHEPFRGSMEIEAFSSQDLKFQFPGLSVFYQTPRGVSYVHSNQRVYNDAEDRARGEPLNPWQSGFDVDTHRFDPFVFIVNGPAAYAGGDVPLVAVRHDGRELRREVRLPPLAPYAVFDLRLAGVEGVAEFLGPRPGTCKIDLPLANVHLRLAAGHALKDQSWLSVTHTYFDATQQRDYFDAGTLDAGVHPAFIPFTLVDGLDVDLVLYPIYAPAKLNLALEAFGADGKPRLSIPLGSWRTPEDGVHRIDVRAALRRQDHADAPGLYVLHLAADDGRLPARITYGLDFRVGDRLGTNISASAYLAKSWGAGKRAWKWGPVVALPGARNLVMVQAFSKRRGEQLATEGTVTLHGATGPVAQSRFVLHGNGSCVVEAEKLLAEAGYEAAAGEILWYVVESAQPSLDVNQVCISADGLVGGDHSF